MKPRSLRLFPQTLVVCVAPILACASAQAKVVYANESNGSNVWILPPGVNLLTGTIPSPATAAVHEGSDSTWSSMTDGSLGNLGGAPATSCTPSNGNVVTFPLDLTSKPGGYNITSFDSYCSWGNSGRDNQEYTLQYSTVANPGTFITIGTVMNRTGVDRSTHTRVTDDMGFLALGVHSVRLIFDTDQENGYTGFREFVLQDAPAVACVSSEANNNNTFSLPGGTNLLTGLTPVEAGPTVQEGSSSSWSTVTDGSVGDYTSTATGVTPSNGQTLTYPLDLTGYPSGRDITSFDSFCAWGSNGRDDQNYTLAYSTVAAPGVFIPITEVIAHTEFNGPNSRKSTHARVTGNGGPMATGVHSIRLTFHNQENGYTGFREFVLKDTPINQTVYESNSTNGWTLPAGTNLLNSASGTVTTPAFVDNANHGNGDITGSDWMILADGSVGSAGIQNQSVAPLDDKSVVFTLKTDVNTKGYDLTSFDAYAAWGDSGRDNQDFTILYSTVELPEVFIPIETINNQTGNPINATHTHVASASGVLATHVGAVKFYFNNQENGYIGYREFVALGNAVPLFSPLTWSGLSGSAGSATWIAGTDNNWKDGAVSSPYNVSAPLTFDTTGTNTTISIPSAITAASMTFTNDNTRPYAFSGQTLTVSNGVIVSGSGSVSFGNSLEASGVTVSGAGSLSLLVDNTLTGSTTVSNGTLNIASDVALGTSSLTLTGGTVNFTSSQPVVSSLGGTGGSVVLGNPAGAGSPTDLYVGDSTSATCAGSISNASGSATGSLVKTGSGTLNLAGTNSYTGTTTVTDGELKLNQRLSLYNGNTALWTDTNIIVQGTSALSLRMGGSGEFTSSDVAALETGGFDFGAVLSLDTTSGNAEISDAIGGDVNIIKQGLNTLKLSGANTFTQGVTVAQDGLEAANPGGVSIPSDLIVGNVTFDVFATTLFDNQFGPNSLIRFNTGGGAVDGKMQLRGTSQTIAGLESGVGNRLAMVQNDEIGSPGYTTNPGPAVLTINAATDHSFKGFIRNQDGGSISLIKKGAGTQEFVNTQVVSYSYNGPTTIENGTLRINFANGNNGFGSNISIEDPGILNFHSVGGGYDFDRIISGPGEVVVTGSNPIALTNGANSWTGGTTVDGGFLALKAINANGQGDGPGQTCCGGAMTPSNVINLINGGTLSLDNAGALGNSPVLPQYAPSIHVNEGSKIYGGTNTIAFVSNITLDGGKIEVTNGGAVAGFTTNLCLVGTVIVGGSSSVPAEIHTTGTGPNANVSLGSLGLFGTVFDVADISPGADLTVSSILTNIHGETSPLKKQGSGTMLLSGANTYTGATTITGGELTVSGDSIADTNRLVINGGKLGLAADETVDTLVLGTVGQAAGTYGSTSSAATHKDDSRFTGTGVLTVVSNPAVTYEDWALIIPNGSDRDRTDDPDGDGFSNLQEFLFGTSPVSATGSLSTVEDTGSGLIVRWNERENSTSVYILQESTTLENPWPASGATITNNGTQDIPDYVRKQAFIPITSAKKFVRVQATE